MAVNDHRVFSHEGEWWAAVVAGAVGAGVGPDPRPQTETVRFTSLSDWKKKSMANTISPGRLNKLSHEAIVRLLDNAEPCGYRWDASGYNTPDREAYREEQIHRDDDGLEWGLRPTQVVRDRPDGPQLVPAVNVQCLHDSALNQVILQNDEFTLADARGYSARDIDEALITTVKGSFEDLDE